MDSSYTINKMAEVMKEKGIRQVDLSNGIGVSPVVVSHWFGGVSTSYMTYLDRIAKFLHVSMDYLVGNNTAGPLDDKEANEYLETLKNRSEMKMLFKAAKGATKKDIERATKIIEVLKDESGN